VPKTQKVVAEISLDRRRKAKGDDRRKAKGDDRRKVDQPVAVERRKIERREKVNRRRQIDPTTCERDYSVDEVEFMNAMDIYKRTSGRMFPTCSEVLEVIRSLGYTKPGMIVPATPVAEPEVESIDDIDSESED
jgi:hypothetical protein